MIPVDGEKNKVKLAPAIPTGAPIAVLNEIIDIPQAVALKIIKILSIKSNIVTYLLNFLLYDFLSLISFDQKILNVFLLHTV